MTNLKINNRPGTTFIGTFDKYKNQEDTSKAKYIAHYIPFPPHPCSSNTKAEDPLLILHPKTLVLTILPSWMVGRFLLGADQVRFDIELGLRQMQHLRHIEHLLDQPCKIIIKSLRNIDSLSRNRW